MAKFYMFYGVQVYEFERPAIVAKPGKAKIAGIKHRLKIKLCDIKKKAGE